MPDYIKLGEDFWRDHLDKDLDDIKRVLLRAEWEDLLRKIADDNYDIGYNDGKDSCP